MPVTGLRVRRDPVDTIIVKRDGMLDSDMDLPVFHLDPDVPADPTPVRRDAMPTDIARRGDGDNDDDDNREHRPPPPILVTMTRAIPQAQATGGQAPTETVVVALPPPPPPPHDKGGISQTTEHLLIAAGSIGATIIVVMVLLGVYHIKKRGLTIAEAMKRTKYSVSRRGPTPPPKKNQWDGSTLNEYTDRKDAVSPPPPTLVRTGSSSSRMPLMAAPQRSDSFNNRAPSPPRAASPPNTTGQSFLIDSPVGPQNSHTRNVSNALSSPVLPLQNTRQSATTQNTQSMADEALQYPEPPRDQRSPSPLPPPPTFRQFLFNRKSVSARPGFGPMVSRFSWTNSQAPQTPHDPSRDTNSHTLQRDSFMTQRSSIPRFRTIDSWVNQQTNRIEEQKLKDQFRFTQSSIATDDDVPDVPEIPKGCLNGDDKKPSPLNNVTNAASETTQSQTRSRPPSPPAPISGLPGKNIKHERHDTTTTQDTAPIFRQHPGNEVRFSQRSLVPSEILNTKMRSSVL